MKYNYDLIIKDTDPSIREKSVDVALPLSDEDKNTLLDLLTYVRDSRDEELAQRENLRPAVGIAAPQVGIHKKLLAIVIEDDDGNPIEYALANAHIVSHSVQQAYLEGGEGCLSVEGEHKGYVPRYAKVKVEGYDILRDKFVSIRARGFLAIVLQHEIDHFNGVLFYDRINKENPFQPIEGANVID
ncbi:MAG: peptide deformylase [Erysipelotrichaceae bacterium]